MTTTDRRCKISDTRSLVLEFAVMEPPARCPHCGDAGPAWRGDALSMACLMCGEDWIRPVGVTGERAA